MKHGHPENMLLAIFAIIFVGLCILCSAGKGMIFYKQSATQKSILRGVDSISEATLSITEDFSRIIEDASIEKYAEYKELADKTARTPMEEEQLDNYFREAVLARFVKTTGGEEGLSGYLESILPEESSGKLYIDPSVTAHVTTQKDESGYIVSAAVDDVKLVYEGIPGTRREGKFRFDINFPDVVFYGGSSELAGYCMMASKGIYATGATSSFVGDIYAGTHMAQESRDIEVSYGEIGSYGGLNFLSTQVGIEAENIISAGDINLSGSFVIFNPSVENNTLNLYGNNIRKMRGYTQDSMYAVDGNFYKTDEMPEDIMDGYLKKTDFAQLTLSELENIPFYYDSVNDQDYKGAYRKIVSSEDVEVKEDFTGIIMTSGSVIIDAGCNVEGLILSNDRIYIEGNNSIVANPSVVKNILSEEVSEENEDVSGIFSVGDDSEASDEISGDIEYYAKDYIGGFTSPGLKKQVYYVIPYQE